uniref:RNase H type-1 domain-containing protein n=2 Tax=Aegilops tauschii subsp. strangulata TaxID=200361 RepID=A0A453JDY5_AEGTS
MAKILNLQEEEHLVNMIGDNSITQAIFNYYPQCPKPDHVLGLKAHTDGSIITVNFADALGISDPASLEALACREALSLAQDLGLQHLQIASDCKHVVNHIRQGVGGSYGSVIREILETVRNFTSCNFVFEPRASNTEAHRLARFYLTGAIFGWARRVTQSLFL